MPPYQQVGSSSYYSDDDDDDADSAYAATGKHKEEEEETLDDVKEKVVVRGVRFAPEDQNRVHVYPGVSTEEHHLVWYTEAEEDAFVMESSLLHSTSTSSASPCNSVSSLVALMLRCDCRDDHNDDRDGKQPQQQVQQQVREGEPTVLSTALLLGSLVVQGVVLRAVLLGHEIREIAAQQQQLQQSSTAKQIHDDLTFFCL